MAHVNHDIIKKRRSKQIGKLIAVRLQPDALARLDEWISKQARRKMTRPEAIRTLAGLN